MNRNRKYSKCPFAGVIVVVKIEGTSFLCKTDEVGEICVNSGATGNQYWGLQGLTNSTFKVLPLQGDGTPLGDAEYVRSGLLGFLGPVSVVEIILMLNKKTNIPSDIHVIAFVGWTCFCMWITRRFDDSHWKKT